MIAHVLPFARRVDPPVDPRPLCGMLGHHHHMALADARWLTIVMRGRLILPLTMTYIILLCWRLGFCTLRLTFSILPHTHLQPFALALVSITLSRGRRAYIRYSSTYSPCSYASTWLSYDHLHIHLGTSGYRGLVE
ncbi:hypothetical protein K523DRAFT_133820 [Schizophyllum commune Tattone D]|nr:hypothetical protein K523DRAFT_133820 [Schizophyllum commune Tattone D]